MLLLAHGREGVMALPNHPDSLHRALYHTDNVENKVSIYLEIAKFYEEVNPDSVAFYWKEAQKIAQRLTNEKPLADVYSQGAFYALKQNQLDLAFLNFSLAARYYNLTGDRKQHVRMKSMLGSICLVRDNIAEALGYYMEVIDVAEELKIYTLLPHVLNNVGNIYSNSDDFSTALGYYSRALELFREIRDTVNIAYPLNNLGESYYYLGNFDLARDYVRQSLNVAEKTNDRVLESRGWMTLGLIKSKLGDYSGAMADLHKSIEIVKSDFSVHPGPSNIHYSEVLAALGEIAFKAGDMGKSRGSNLEGFSIARSMKQLGTVRNTARYLSLIHEQAGRYDSALFYHKIFSDMADSVSSSGNVRAVKLMEIRQEYLKKQKENELNVALEKSSRRTILIIYSSGAIVLLAVIVILFLMLKIEKQRKRQAETEKQGLNEKLEYQNKELTTNVMYLTRMNELVVALAEKLRKLTLTDGSENSAVVKSIINELERTSNPDNWKEFEVRFQKVHTDFYRKLSLQFSDLTPNELKLCAFLRLNMSTKEISAITFQSQNSIMVARSRLRQKLGIAKDENLVTFLAQM